MPPCGSIDGRYSTWPVQNFLRMKMEKPGVSRTISSTNLEQTPHDAFSSLFAMTHVLKFLYLSLQASKKLFNSLNA